MFVTEEISTKIFVIYSHNAIITIVSRYTLNTDQRRTAHAGIHETTTNSKIAAENDETHACAPLKFFDVTMDKLKECVFPRYNKKK